MSTGTMNTGLMDPQAGTPATLSGTLVVVIESLSRCLQISQEIARTVQASPPTPNASEMRKSEDTLPSKAEMICELATALEGRLLAIGRAL